MTDDEIRELQKVKDAIDCAVRYFVKRDEMNAEMHLSTTPRYSPLTVRMEAAQMTLGAMIDPPVNF